MKMIHTQCFIKELMILYLLAQKNVNLIEQLIEIKLMEEELMKTDHLTDFEKGDRIQNLDNKLIHMISNCSVNDLKVVYAIASIGTHERGYRHYSYKETIEIIELEICKTYEELLAKHTKYIEFYTKKELEHYILRFTHITSSLREGLKILNLK